MSQKWTFKEYPIAIHDVEPGSRHFTDIAIRPSARPFRLESIIADAKGFHLAACTVGKKTLFDKDGSDFPATGFFATAESGTIIMVEVNNTSGEKNTFKGRLVGKELID